MSLNFGADEKAFIVFDQDMRVWLSENAGLCYPSQTPYSPHEYYPEYPFDHIAESKNYLYPAVRKMFLRLGYDKENYGKKNWNPLGELIVPGQKVCIKPNWVLHHNSGAGSLDGLITHPALIRVVIDYIVIALKGAEQLSLEMHQFNLLILAKLLRHCILTRLKN